MLLSRSISFLCFLMHTHRGNVYLFIYLLWHYECIYKPEHLAPVKHLLHDNKVYLLNLFRNNCSVGILGGWLWLGLSSTAILLWSTLVDKLHLLCRMFKSQRHMQSRKYLNNARAPDWFRNMICCVWRLAKQMLRRCHVAFSFRKKHSTAPC